MTPQKHILIVEDEAKIAALLQDYLRDAEHSGVKREAALVRVDEDQFVAAVGGRMLDLTPVEFRLLHTLISTPGRVYSRAQLLDLIYTDHRVVSDRTVDSHVKNLRRKLSQSNPEADAIRSVYGVGYRWEPAED